MAVVVVHLLGLAIAIASVTSGDTLGLAIAHPRLTEVGLSALFGSVNILWGVEDVLLIKGDIVFGKELDVFVFGGDLLVVCLLAVDVASSFGTYRFTDGECTVSSLPSESNVMFAFCF